MNDVSVNLGSKHVRDFFARDITQLKNRLMQLETEIDADAIPQLNDVHHHATMLAIRDSERACREFEREHEGNPTLIADVQAAFRQETEPWLGKSWFAHRARTKPSGFPGDYEMLRVLYDQTSPPTTARGLGGYLDLCLMDSPLANAVRARLKDARKFLIEQIQARTGEIRILDIASGPCREYVDWPQFEAGRDIEIMALDSDPLALDFVNQKVAPQVQGSKFGTVRYNALRTRSSSGNRRRFGEFDIIYSVGLCDYLPDDHLIGMLSAWRDTLKDDGVMYVAFKDCTRYDKTLYQWHLDWFFFQRTRQEMIDLYSRAGFDVDAMQMTRDSTGIIIQFVNKARSSSAIRIDPPHETTWRSAATSIENHDDSNSAAS